MKQFSVKKSVLAVGLTLAYSHVVFADEAIGDQPIQKVYVTGSRVAQIESETASPLTVVKRADIARTGAKTVNELLKTMTSSTGGLDDIGGGGSFAPGASSVSLRNMGQQSTLILLNSRRVAPYALADYNEVFTNIDALPLEAIERVEILRNGGSAVYGSDAVAGVINIITRDDYEGVQTKASHERSLKNGDLNTSNASITAGKGNFGDDGYNVVANLEVYKRKAVNWRQLVDDINPAYGDKFDAVAPGSGLMFGQRGSPSSLSYPGNTDAGPLKGCTTIDGGLCQYDRYERFQAVPQSDRVNGMVSGKLRINDSVEAFAEVLYSQTKTKYMSAFANYSATNPDEVWGNPRTGERLTFTSLYLPSAHPLNDTGAPTDLLYRFGDSDSSSTVKSSQYRVLTGLKGNLGKYDWETAVGVMGGKTKLRSRGTFSSSGFKRVIGDYSRYDADHVPEDENFFNRDYKIGVQNSPEVLATLFPEFGYDGKITQSFVDGKIDGDIASLGGRPVKLAVGGELRHEKFQINPTANLLDGDIVGNGSSTADAKRMTGAAFAEVSAPVTDKLELNAAARVDKYEHFDAHVSPKLSFRFAPTKQVMFRGTVETGFRAPNLTESAQSSKYSFEGGVVDPQRCSQALSLAKDLRAEADALPEGDARIQRLNSRADVVEGNECGATVFSNVRHNPHLKPETSRSATLGFVVEPFEGYTLTVDYWRIERKDEIGLKSTADLLTAEADQPAGVIERGSLASDKTFTADERREYGVTAGPLAGTAGMFENVSKTKTSGFDLTGSARFKTGFGKVNVDANATYLTSLRYHSSTRNAYGDNLAGRYGTPKLVSNATVTLDTGKLSNSLRASFDSGYRLRGDFYDDSYTNAGCAERGWNASECKVGSYVRWDYTVAYRGFKRWTLTAFVRNLFDHRPPTDLRAFGNGGGGIIPQSLEDVQGRSLRLSAEYKF